MAGLATWTEVSTNMTIDDVLNLLAAANAINTAQYGAK